ncbi:MAG: ferritin-like protein [bacterium]
MKTDRARLRHDLRTAMTIELATLPTYLYTMMTLRPDRAPARQAIGLIRRVAYEEMLHMALVGNLINALGFQTAITDPAYVPDFTKPLPLPGHSTTSNPFTVVLRPFGPEAIATFLDIELPAYDDPGQPTTEGWATIGQFYQGIEAELPTDDAAYGHGRQMAARGNPAAGVLFAITSHATAVAALSEIVHQGEGLGQGHENDGDHELSHYWRFKEVETLLTSGQIDLERDVLPVVADPYAHLGAYTEAQQVANRAFNAAYSELLDALQATFTSAAPEVYGASTAAMEAMPQKAAVLRALGPIPGTDRLAGPTFEYLPRGARG